jgi:chaperonin cofactor prefoldin
MRSDCEFNDHHRCIVHLSESTNTRPVARLCSEAVKPLEAQGEIDSERIRGLQANLKDALHQVSELQRKLADEEDATFKVIAERDHWEEVLGRLAHAAGCQEEGSNLHEHGECIGERIRALQSQVERTRKDGA